MRQILRRTGVFLLIAAALPAQESRPAKKILFLTHSAGYVHDVVRRPSPDSLSPAEVELNAIAKAPLWSVECTQDCSVLTARNLAKYDVVAFYTTGELPAPPGGAEALVEWVRGGGAFLGIHCATDTWYKVPAYGDMVGGVFESHPWNQRVRVRNESFAADPDCPLGDGFEIEDEIYQFKRFEREPLDVFLSLDPTSVNLAKGSRKDADYALAWFREYGEGRVFYTALGHGERAWRHESFRRHLEDGLAWLRLRGPRDGWAPPGARVLTSAERFGDFRLHLEFRGKGGVYLQGRYEIRLFGKNPGEWRSCDVRFTAARFDAAGRKTAKARASVWEMGLRIQDDAEIDGPSGGGEPEGPAPGPIRLEDHGDLVAYRNVWVVPR